MQFQTFLRLYGGRLGSLFNASELSSEVSVSVNPKGGIIPIQTEAPEKFEELFWETATIIRINDDEPISLNDRLRQIMTWE